MVIFVSHEQSKNGSADEIFCLSLATEWCQLKKCCFSRMVALSSLGTNTGTAFVIFSSALT